MHSRVSLKVSLELLEYSGVVLQAGRGFCGSGAEALPKYSQSTPTYFLEFKNKFGVLQEYSWVLQSGVLQAQLHGSWGAGVGAYSQPLKIKTPTKLRKCLGTPLAICATLQG